MKQLLIILLLSFLSKVGFTQESTEKGKFVLKTNFNEKRLLINNDIENALEITNRDTLEFEKGRYTFTIVSPFRNDYTFYQEIYPDSTVVINFNLQGLNYNPFKSSYPVLHWNSNLMIYSEPGSKISVDNEAFDTSMVSLNLDAGIYKINVSNGDFSRSKFVNIIDSKLQVLPLSTLPRRRTATFLSFIPGASQFYKQQPLKGATFALGILALASGSILYDQKFKKADNDFLRYRTEYYEATNPNEIFRLVLLAEQSSDDAKKYSTFRNRTIFAIGAFYILNIADGLFTKPKRGFFEPWDFNPYTDFRAQDEAYFGVKLSRSL